MSESPPTALAMEQKPHAVRISPAAWRYLLMDQGLIAIVVNFVINWGIAWLIFRRLAVVPLDGELSLVGDTVSTCVLLPLIACLIVTTLTRKEVSSGRIPSLFRGARSSGPWRFLPRNVVVRAGLCALLGRLLLAPPAVFALREWGVQDLSLWNFLWFKALFAVGLGLFFCPFYAWWALHDPVPVADEKSA